MTRRLILTAVLLVAVAGCGSSGPPCEDYGNLFNSPSGLILTQGEHPTGWGRHDCLACHNVGNIHCVNRTGVSTLNLADVREVVSRLGQASCVECHGTNGVQP